MTRSRRYSRRSTSQRAASLLALALPAPMQRVADTRLGPLLMLLGIPTALVGGLLNINWENGTPQWSIDPNRAAELRAATQQEWQRLEHSGLAQSAGNWLSNYTGIGANHYASQPHLQPSHPDYATAQTQANFPSTAPRSNTNGHYVQSRGSGATYAPSPPIQWGAGQTAINTGLTSAQTNPHLSTYPQSAYPQTYSPSTHQSQQYSTATNYQPPWPNNQAATYQQHPGQGYPTSHNSNWQIDGSGQNAGYQTAGPGQYGQVPHYTQQPGYSQPTYTQPAYPQPTYSQPAWSQSQPAQSQYSQPSYAPSGYPQPNYTQPNYTQPSYMQPGYTQPNYNQPALQPQYPSVDLMHTQPSNTGWSSTLSQQPTQQYGIPGYGHTAQPNLNNQRRY